MVININLKLKFDEENSFCNLFDHQEPWSYTFIVKN